MSNNTNNINSFAQNMSRTVTQQTNQLAMLRAMQESMSSEDAYVTFDYKDADGNTLQYQIPSYDSIVRRLQAVEESLGALADGKGSVSLRDGSRRTVTLSTIPHTPERITGLTDPSTFSIDSNWFFEELMFPGARVSINLTGQIEDTADRVRVTRIILDNNNNSAQTLWESDLSQNQYDYVTLKNVLSQNGVPYYEDEETVELPLVSNQVAGSFLVTEDPVVRNGSVWYTLDNITYSTISSDGVEQGQNNILSVGDRLSYQESIFEILEIDQNSYSVRLRRTSGVQSPGVYSIFRIYQDPFREKIVKVRFGAHEYNIIYFKGVSENYNLLADVWSTPVKFSSDDLILEGTAGLQQTPFSSYYNQYIVDWGSEMIANYRDQKIPAYSGHIPNAPVLNGSEFRVVLINTQINAAIDTTDVKNTAAEIQSVKSQIASLKQTIASQKSEAQGISEQYAYNALQQQIATNVNDLNNLQTTYSTLVSSFQSIVRENSAVTTPPKYHIRGFFPIPDFKYRDEDETIPEEIIGFDIAYRYIKEDSTATQLNTFTYTSSDGSEHTGTFTDWIIENGPIKTKLLDSTDGKFVWKSENIADGTETNINQIDIAISKGEKVEIKVRSISECGYPYNPLRSEWSESVIIDFPPTLATGNLISDLIEEINSDALTLTVLNNLDSLGVTDHLKDSVANKNSVNGMYFKHLAENIAYELTTTDSSGNIVINSISVLKRLDDIFSVLNNVSGTVDISQTTITSIQQLLDKKIAEYDINILNISTGLIETSKAMEDVSNGLYEILSLERDTSANYHPKVSAERYSLINLDGIKLSYVSLDDTGNNTDVWFREQTGGNAAIHAKNIILEVNNDKKIDISAKLSLVDSSINTKASNTSLNILNDYISDVSTNLAYVNTELNNVSTNVKQNTDFINNISINNGLSIKANKFYITNNNSLLCAAIGFNGGNVVIHSPNDDKLLKVNVDDINFIKDDNNTGTESIKNVYRQLTISNVSVNTLNEVIEDISNKISFVKKGEIDTDIDVNVAEVQNLTVKNTATFKDIEFADGIFRPRHEKQDMIAYFNEIYLTNLSGEIVVSNELANLKSRYDEVRDIKEDLDTLFGKDSGGTTAIESIKAINSEFTDLTIDNVINIGLCVINCTGSQFSINSIGSSGSQLYVDKILSDIATVNSNFQCNGVTTVLDININGDIRLNGKINAANVIMPNGMDLATYVKFLVDGGNGE